MSFLSKLNRKIFLLFIVIVVFFHLLLLLVGLVGSFQVYSAVKKFDFQQAQIKAQQIKIIPKYFQIITLNLIKDFTVWRQSLDLISHTGDLFQELNINQRFNVLSDSMQSKGAIDFIQIKQNFELINDQLEQIRQSVDQTILLKHKLNSEQIRFYSQMLADLQVLMEFYLSDEHNLVLLLQNQHEIRATGGFMGSLALVNINQGQLASLEFQDIYDADGQFHNYVPAPDGVKQYLSSGQGMSLPDANWSPDFASSANQILVYLQAVYDRQFDTIIAVNASLIADLLEVIGPIEIADYDLVVDKDNFYDVMRMNRQEFFPSSKQKKHLISLLFNQIQIKLQNSSSEQINHIGSIIFNDLVKKDLQFYSQNQQIQHIFRKYGLSGEILGVLSPYHVVNLSNVTPTQLVNYSEKSFNVVLALVESNVGINKANKAIVRNVTLDISENDLLITVNFQNNNLKPNLNLPEYNNPYLLTARHLGYVNYQRIITQGLGQINYVYFNDQTIDQVNVDQLTTSHQAVFDQAGFLITLPEKESGTLQVSYQLFDFADHPRIFIVKQSGLPSTHYIINYQDQTREFDLLHDQLIDLSNY